MIALWTWCMLLAADPAPAPFHVQLPPALQQLLETDGQAPDNHQGYIAELAQFPDLAESESAWWQAVSQPALRGMVTRFNESLAASEEGTPPIRRLLRPVA